MEYNRNTDFKIKQDKHEKYIKCDFCTQSKPNGDCYWDNQTMREYYCKTAIKRMMSVIKIK